MVLNLRAPHISLLDFDLSKLGDAASIVGGLDAVSLLSGVGANNMNKRAVGPAVTRLSEIIVRTVAHTRLVNDLAPGKSLRVCGTLKRVP